MLQNLYIQNYALIDELNIQFGEGFNVITGETGAGKSILLGALNLILGARADSSVISLHGSKCVVEASFQLNSNYKNFFEENELDFEAQCIVRREINVQGKSRAFINDTPVNLGVLKELASMLVDLHEQHETNELNGPQAQLDMVDAMARNRLLLDEYILDFQHLKKLETRLKELEETEAESARERDFIQFLYSELDEAKLKPGEQVMLEEEQEQLTHVETIQEDAREILNNLSEHDGSVLQMLNHIKNRMQHAGKFHAGLEQLAARIESSLIELKDIQSETEKIADSISADPHRLEEVDQRLKLLFHLAAKHRVKNADELVNIYSSLGEKLGKIDSLAEDIKNIQDEMARQRKLVNLSAERISESRSAVIPAMEKELNKMLKEVGLEKAKLRIEVKALALPGISGKDEVSILFSSNTGSPFISLQKTASGGELSRLMLCLRTCIAGKVELPTLIFDEIDTGISGETAIKVGQMMKKLSASHQLISITHLPQIAGKALHHYTVYKEEKSGKTYTKVKALSNEEQVKEIARMLGGANFSEAALKAAVELKG